MWNLKQSVLDNFLHAAVPGLAQLPAIKLLYHDSFSGSVVSLYRETRNAQLSSYHDGKKHTMPRSFRMHRDSTPIRDSAGSRNSLINNYLLYCRDVIANVNHPGTIFAALKLSIML